MPCDVTDESRVSMAAAAAASADLTILVIGDGSTTSTAKNATPYEREVATVGEHFDRDDLDPAGAQMPLMRAVMKAGKSVIIVMIGGRPMTFGASALDGYNKMFADASAVIAAWHPGAFTSRPTVSISRSVRLAFGHIRLARSTSREPPMSPTELLPNPCRRGGWSRAVEHPERYREPEWSYSPHLATHGRAGAYVRAALPGDAHTPADLAVRRLRSGHPTCAFRMGVELFELHVL